MTKRQVEIDDTLQECVDSAKKDMEQKFIVISEDQPMICDAKSVISAIDMGDCCHVEAVYRVRDPLHSEGELERLQIHGPWHADDPLYIKVTNANGEIVCDGYGTDH